MSDREYSGDEQPDFLEQLNKLLNQLGLNVEGGQMDLAGLMSRMQAMGASSPFGFGFTPAQTDPDAAWRTTITAAIHQLPSLGGDPRPTAEQVRQFADASRLASSWLDQVTTFPAVVGEAESWTREQWLSETGPAWRRLVEPIIDGLASALGSSVDADSPELAAMQQAMAPMLRTSASAMYHEQLKSTLAKLASTVTSASELGLPMVERPVVAMLPTSVASFAQDLEQPADDIALYLTLRETARQRLFASVAWLRPQLDALFEHYAREIRIDMDFITSQFNFGSPEDLSIEKIAEVGKTVTGSFFEPASTPTQLEILGRLETLLALVEGWVDEVTAQTCATWMPNASALAEAVRRRRAAGGPSEQVFASLVGLDLRPRRVRDAENLWASLTHSQGTEARDAVWGHPDLMPTSADLDDPLSFTPGRSSEPMDDLDEELAKLLNPDA